MLFPQLTGLDDLALFALRVVLALVFAASGWSHVTSPRERAESIGMSPAFTAGLGVVELTGSLLLVAGVLVQLGALLLMGVMVGAIYKKIFVWHTGFWGEESRGWYYDLLYFTGNLVVLTTAGGAWTIV